MKTHKHKKSQKAQDGSMSQITYNTRSPKRKQHVKILRGRFPFQDLFGYIDTTERSFGHSRGN